MISGKKKKERKEKNERDVTVVCNLLHQPSALPVGLLGQQGITGARRLWLG